MKRILFLFFAISSLFLSAQTVVFKLTDNKTTYNSSNCLTPKTDYSKVYLAFKKGDELDIKSFKLVITLNKKINYTFNSYNELRNTDPLSWLQDNKAFEQFKFINFAIEVVLPNDKKETQNFNVCLKGDTPKIVTRSFTNTTTKKKDYIEIPVSFATDRNDTKDSDLNDRFGGKRAEIQYGRVVVSIPYNHKLGEIERPSYWRLEFSEDPTKHVVIQSLKKQNKDDFFNQMKNRIAKNGKSTFLFVHGYNVSFADAAMRTAQITFDLRFSGEPVFYSWPSQGSTASYTIDEANIEWARLNMKNFLRDYLTKTEADDIYLVAHSMGNRGLTKALIELMNEHPDLKNKITEIILAAPDIDADVFRRDIAPQMVKKIQKPITLYVSSDDLALVASRKVHGNARAGDAGRGVVVVKGVETIDASGVDTSFLSHSYFATAKTIIEDILDLIKSGKRAAYRETLERVSRENVIYWKVKQGKD
ncbi:MAG: alpha/beta hydrolase [Flavobacteriaceae bacterium]|nr:alpha/beta hydrolase [Flavobacteriaceae bacterium]